MEPLIMPGSNESPGINFDKQNNKFMIFGKSFPEEAKRFFDPALMWLEEYLQNPNEETIFEIRLDYYNSATATMLLEIFYMLEKIVKAGKKVKVVWNYLEIDDDMLDAGEEYKEMLELPFEFRAIKDTE